MNYDTPNLRKDLIFDGTLPGDDYRKLGLGEELMIIDFVGPMHTLKDRMYRWGKDHGVRFRVTYLRNRTYIKCLPRKKRRVRTKTVGKVGRWRTVHPDRSTWRRHADTGIYWCLDFKADITWEIRRDGDAVFPWTIYRGGKPVARARTIYDAKREAAALL